MKIGELCVTAQKELASEKEKEAIKTIKRKLIELEELKKAMKIAEEQLNELLDTDLEDFDVDLW